jgi:hypothetical protein
MNDVNKSDDDFDSLINIESHIIIDIFMLTKPTLILSTNNLNNSPNITYYFVKFKSAFGICVISPLLTLVIKSK